MCNLKWPSVHVKYNACVIQSCFCCYHTKSGFSEFTVVDVGVSSTAGCTTNWCPDSLLSKIGLADDVCGCEYGCGCGCGKRQVNSYTRYKC